MDDTKWRDLVVEERAGDATSTVRDVQAGCGVLRCALIQVALEVCRAVLVRVDLNKCTIVS